MNDVANERPPTGADPETPDLGTVPGWLPVAEGVRHISGLGDEPPVDVLVEMLCGRQVTVPRRRRRVHPALFDCTACWHVWLDVGTTLHAESPTPDPNGRATTCGSRRALSE